MADTLDTIRDTAQSLMSATGAPQMGKAMAGIGSAATRAYTAAKDTGSKILGTKPPARDIELPKDPAKRTLRRGRR